jgi:hypothetical protein
MHDVLNLPLHERLALASSLEAVARMLRGDLAGPIIRGDEEAFACDLLQAWWLELGSEAVGVADVFNVRGDTKLGEIVAKLVEASDGNSNRARNRLGKTLRKLSLSGRAFGGYSVRNLGPYCGSVTWACEPMDPPHSHPTAGAD